MNKMNVVVFIVVALAVAGVASLVWFVSPEGDAGHANPVGPLDVTPQPPIRDPGQTQQQSGQPDTAESPQPPKVAILHKLPDFKLSNQAGVEFGTDQLFGRVWLTSFFNASFTASVSKQSAGMAEIRESLDDSGLQSFYQALNERTLSQDVRLVSVSLQPDLATEALSELAAEVRANDEQWQFLAGSQQALDSFREGVHPGMQFDDDRPSAITSQIMLIDPQGYMRGFYDTTSAEQMAALKRDLLVVAQERFLLNWPDLIDPAWLDMKKRKQLDTLDQFEVFHEFSFEDRVVESGIRFRNRIVDDSGRTWKPAHYDHGNGVAVADVDGDGLLDIYFVTQVGRNELWKNVGAGKFEDITDAAGVDLAKRIGVTASFADIDNDGDADLYVTNVRGGNVMFENDGAGEFKDISEESGLGYDGHSSSAVFFDYNRDGLLDLFLVNVGIYTTSEVITVENDAFSGPDTSAYQYYSANPDAFVAHIKPGRSERSILFENQGQNRFIDVTEKVKLVDESWSGDASPLDVNGDGWPDLYVINMQGHDEYYENVEGKEFVKRSRELFPATPWGTMGIKVFDFDNDGGMDIYLTDMHTDMATDLDPLQEKAKIPKEEFEADYLASDGNHIWGNAFFRNLGGEKYEEISDRIGAENYWPWGLSVGDLNADGFEDVFITASMNYQFRYAVNSLLLNNKGKEFLDSELLLGVEPRRRGRTAIPWFELATKGNEKTPEVMDLAKKGIHLDRIVPWGALGSRSSVIFDLDGDGDLDIVTNDFNSEPMVLISDLTDKTEALHYLQVKLVGAKSNRDGLGATVVVQAGSQSYTKVHDGQSGYLSQSLCPLYFGLGDTETVERIEISWPSGASQVIEGPVEINRTLEITETAE